VNKTLYSLGAQAVQMADTFGCHYSTQGGGMPTRREVLDRIAEATRRGELENVAGLAIFAQTLPAEVPSQPVEPTDQDRRGAAEALAAILRTQGYGVAAPAGKTATVEQLLREARAAIREGDGDPEIADGFGSLWQRTPARRLAFAALCRLYLAKQGFMPVSFAPTLEELNRLLGAFACITRREFRTILRQTIQASGEYADGCIGSFHANPIGYCYSRSARTQGDALLELALEKMRRARETGRVLGCPGEGRCHDGAARCDSCGETAYVCHAPADCDFHKPVRDAEIEAAVLAEFLPQPGSLRRARSSRDGIVATMTQRFEIRRGYTPDRAEAIRDALLAAGKIGPAIGPNGRPWPDGWLQAPLPTLKPGEHSDQCPVTVEHWHEADHDPDVCSWAEPVLKVWQVKGDIYVALTAADAVAMCAANQGVPGLEAVPVEITESPLVLDGRGRDLTDWIEDNGEGLLWEPSPEDPS
jgi:hypothetical protein